MSKLAQRLETLTQLITEDNSIKSQQEKLNQKISQFISDELGLKGPATLLDISKTLLETSFEPTPRIITP
jgi:hypothetical protein